MIHKLSKGSNQNLFITLHGTGGEVDQLFGVAQEIDKEATLLGIQGNVIENGMNRYFERYPNGDFNFDSLDKETNTLFNYMNTLIESLGYADYNLYIMGYSNGANMITNLLRKHVLKAKGVLIFHPAIMRMQIPFLKQNNLSAFISSGKNDPYFSIDALESMEKSMRDVKIAVTTYMQPYEHQLTKEEIISAKAWFNTINTELAIFKDFVDLDVNDQRKLVNGSIVPRPIAWISTLNEDDSVNLAPFSYFNIVASDILSVSFIPKQNGKDTLRNILRTKEAVINSVSIRNIEKVTLSGIEHDYMESEAEIHGIDLVPSTLLKTPSVKEAYVSFETTLLQHIPLSDENGNRKADMVLLKVRGATFREGILAEEKNYIDLNILDPASRLSGVAYGNTHVVKPK